MRLAPIGFPYLDPETHFHYAEGHHHSGEYPYRVDEHSRDRAQEGSMDRSKMKPHPKGRIAHRR